jgi:inosose dehydratase
VTGLAARVAGAPISWGVCEVPGWGYQLAPDRVLGEMRSLGLAATELGPAGFLPAEPTALAATLRRYGLAAVGGFMPVLLHEPGHDPAPAVATTLAGFAAVGARVLVLAAATGRPGYDVRPELDGPAWATLLGNLDRLAAAAAERGVIATLHPHAGTVVERYAEVMRVLDGCGVPLTLDTGHLTVGGTDPAELARQAADRVAHAHLKDVDAGLAARVRAGELSYAAAVRAGLYRPLGRGDVDIAGIVAALEGAGYRGWYVLEQDTVLAGPADDPAVDVRASLAFLCDLLGGGAR